MQLDELAPHLLPEPPLPPPPSEDEVFVFPASFAQARLWFLDRLDPGSFAYNVHQTLRLEGRLDVAALRGALTGMIERHETLRTTFALRDGEPVQVVAAAGLPAVLLADLRGLPLAEREPAALRLALREAHTPFDLVAGPLLRVVAVRLGDAEHLLVLTVHHIVCDGWSVSILIRELRELYDAAVEGRPAALPELPLQYADYAAWQRQWLQGEVLDEHLRWWRQRIEEAPPVLPLPTDRPRPAARSGRGGRRPVALPGPLADALTGLGRALGATPFMALLAGFHALLHRLTGQPRILVGTPVAGRDSVETEGLIGCFLNLLVMAADVDAGQGLRALLAQVREATLGAFVHQEIPFEMLVKEMGLERGLAQTPIFQVLFALQNAPRGELRLTGLRLAPVEVGLAASKFDLSLSLAQAEDGIRGSLEHDADLFDATTIDRFLAAWGVLLAAGVTDPEAPLGSLPLLPEAERHQVLVEWGGGAAEATPDLPPVAVAFARRAAAAPDGVALIHGGDRLTFEELHLRAKRVARRLHAAGVGPGGFVGLCAERTPDLIAGLLGIFAAGAAFVPLDPAHPDERLAFLVADSGVRAVLAEAAQDARVRTLAGERTVVLPLAAAEEDGREQDLAEILPAADAPAYLIYTSGTTGQPKAVVVEQRNLSSLLAAVQSEVGWTPADRMVSAAPFSFDIFLFELLSPLLEGGSVVLVPLRPVIDLDELVSRLGEATAFHAVPSLMRQVVEAVRLKGPLRGPRHLFVGGDAVPPELLADMAAAFPAARLRILYGPTEATILSSCHTVAATVRLTGSLLGRPLDHSVLRVLDAQGHPTPVGVPGEIWIGGAGVARGYLGRPELTAEQFVVREGHRFYRSGDRGRWRPDGCLEFLGRLDGQVKVRGFRIEPREVEAAVTAHPGVREAVVVARQEPGEAGGERRLVAYVVPAVGESLPDDLRAFLLGRLPEHMIPALLVPLAALPLTSHGKVDLRALPVPGGAARAEEPGFVAPRNPLETALAEVWEGVLGLPRVGVHDNFFRLGGDSILSLQIVARARRRGLAFTARQLFESQTVAELAPRVVAASVAIGEQGTVEGEAPLAPAQRRFFEELPAEPWHFNQTILLETAVEISVAALRRAFALLTVHHDALRLRFLPVSEGWRQVHASLDEAVVRRLPFAEVDLSVLPEEWRTPALEEVAAAVQGSLDITRGPLLRGVAFRFGAGLPGRLLLTVHHLVVDGVSWRILLEDLRTALNGQPFPEKTTSWKRWTTHLEALARSPEIAEEAAWWLALPLEGLMPLPVDHPGGVPLPGTLESVPGGLAAVETGLLLTEAPRPYNARVEDLLLAALALAVARWTAVETKGDGRVLLEMEGHGRDEEGAGIDVTRTVGWFTVSWPQILDVRGAAGPAEAIRAVKEQLRRVPRRGLGWALLRDLRGDERLRALPRPRLTFNYLGQLDGAVATAGPLRPATESPGPAQSPRAVRSSWLDVLAGVVGGSLRVSWTWSPAVFRRETIAALASGFDAALRELIEHCLSPGAGGFTPADFPLADLEAGELDQVLAAQGGPGSIEDVLPLSPLQQGLWFHAQMAPESSAYFEQMSMRLRGDLDVAALRRAWQRVVNRHTALRTAFVARPNGEPLQVVHRRVDVAWELLDWSDLPPAAQEERARVWTAADRARPFDLARPPLMRFALARLGEGGHRFFWSHHHLLMDGWCLPQVLDEVLAGYQAFRAGREPDLPASRPYRDYIAWLRRQDLAAARELWRRTLAGFSEPTPLPIVRPASAGPERFVAHHLRVPAPLAAALREQARSHHLTLNTLVQGAWAWLLSRYSGRDDVVFGAVVSGRPADLPGVESIVGMFINTLPVRVAVPAATPLDLWLAALQERQAELRQTEHTSLVEIQGCGDVPHGQALFESLLAFESRPPRRNGEGSEAVPVPLEAEDFRPEAWTELPLTVLCVPEGDLSFVIKHDARRFETGAIPRLAGHLESVLCGLAEGLERPVGSLRLLTAAERHQAVCEWNEAPSVFAEDGVTFERPVHHLVEARADRHPGAPAVACEGATLTYAELDVRANQLAHRLRELGVGADARVGVCLEHSLEMVVAVFGILKAGGAYVGLDPEMPAERLGWVLADSGACSVITESRLRDRLPADLPLPVVDLASERDELARRDRRRPAPLADLGHLVYLIYTSGSTGRPKGVLTEHRQLLSYLGGILVPLAPRPGDRWALHQQLAVDAPVTYLFASLATGGVLHLIARDRVARPDALGEYFERHEIDFFKAAPSHFAALLAGEQPERVLPRRLLMLGGEASRRDWIREVRRLAPGCVLLNHYGPTETTVGVLTWAVDEPGLSASPPTLPLGRPLSGVRIHVLDRWLDPAPVGVPGELYVGGDSLARGYRLRPDLTAERFVPDPDAPVPGARLYRTGDLVRRLPDGTPEFLGRVDHQVKIRGFRIELEEVEAVLAQHPAVRTCVAGVREDAVVGRHLAAWVAAEPGGVGEAELRVFLQDRLPAYMVPAVFVILPELPRTAQGKVDRKALPAPAAPGSSETAADAPRTPAEELMAGIWCEVLGVDRVGLVDDFFSLRGHSLLAAQIVARVRTAFGVDLPLRALFEHPTVAGLVGAVEEARGGTRAPALLPAPREGSLPLSFAQQRLWFLDQLEPGSHAYNITRGVRLRGPLDLAALHRALTEVVRRHEVLRTRYAAADGEPVQVIDPPGEVRLPLVDLRRLPEAERERELDRVVVREARLSFDLAHGPVLRATVVRLGDDDHAALFTVHHIACDGWSLRLMERELGVLYGAFRGGTASPSSRLPALPVQYADFAVWERGWLRDDVLTEHLAWWRRLLGGRLPSLELPTDRPRPERLTSRGGRQALRIPADLAERLRALGRREGATLFMVLLAGFAALLYRLSRQDDLVIGADVTNRSRRETEGLIGFFINMLALRVDLAGNPPFRELLARVREVALGAYAHQDLPFEKLVEEVQPQRASGHSPLFRVVFNFNSQARLEDGGEPDGGEVLPGLEARPLGFEYETVRFDLTLLMSEQEDGLNASWTYSVDLFDATTVTRWHQRFETLLASAAERPDLRLDALEIVGAREREEEAELQRQREEALRGKLLGLRARRPQR